MKDKPELPGPGAYNLPANSQTNPQTFSKVPRDPSYMCKPPVLSPSDYGFLNQNTWLKPSHNIRLAKAD
jgi:hypothetical protein